MKINSFPDIEVQSSTKQLMKPKYLFTHTLPVCQCACQCVCVCVCVCCCMCICICVVVCMYVCGCMCMCMCVVVYMCVCGCMYVYGHTCVSDISLTQGTPRGGFRLCNPCVCTRKEIPTWISSVRPT